MKQRKVKVVGDHVVPLPDRLEGTHVVNLTQDQYDKYTSAKWFTVDEQGLPIVRPEAEVEAEDLLIAREQKRRDLKTKLHKDMSETTVELNGKTFWADPKSEQNFSGRIREMEISGKTTTKWAQGFDVFEATLDELKLAVIEGTKKNATLWDTYISDIQDL